MESEKNHSPQPQRFTLRKAERLRHRTLVEQLFEHGESLYDFPLRLKWRILDSDSLAGAFRIPTSEKIGRMQMMITVPKKRRKRAVDRVLLRRRIREAYRLNRHILFDALDKRPDIASLEMAFIYIHDDNIDYQHIEKKMIRLLHKIESALLPEAAGAPETTLAK